MKKISSIIIAAFLPLLILAGPQQQELIHAADSAYNHEQFNDAIAKYEEVLSQAYESAELYYNLGNAYFNINDLPAAILYYEKARVLAPRDADINFNLNIANSMIPDKIDVVPEIFYIRWWKSLRDNFNIHTWTLVSLAMFILAVFGAGFFFLSRSIRLRKFAFWTGIILIVFSLVSFSITYTKYQIQSKHLEAIVFDPTITVKSSPNQLGKDLFVIHEGTKVFILGKMNTWCNIKIANGSTGWLPEAGIRRI